MQMDIHLAQETTYADMAKDLSNEVVYCFLLALWFSVQIICLMSFRSIPDGL